MEPYNKVAIYASRQIYFQTDGEQGHKHDYSCIASNVFNQSNIS